MLNVYKMLKHRIDMFAYEINVARYELKSHHLNPDDFKVVYVLQKSDLYYAFNKDTDDSVIQAYQEALDRIKATNFYQRIIHKYK
jgi:ABC-type amino acid transport substrate-binding protein